jgi:hypothetical protein
MGEAGGDHTHSRRAPVTRWHGPDVTHHREVKAEMTNDRVRMPDRRSPEICGAHLAWPLVPGHPYAACLVGGDQVRVVRRLAVLVPCGTGIRALHPKTSLTLGPNPLEDRASVSGRLVQFVQPSRCGIGGWALGSTRYQGWASLEVTDGNGGLWKPRRSGGE